MNILEIAADGDVHLLFDTCDAGSLVSSGMQDAGNENFGDAKARSFVNGPKNENCERITKIRMQTSSLALIQSSRVFKAMLKSSAMSEAHNLQSKGSVEISLPDDDADNFRIIMDIIHDNKSNIPKQISSLKLAELALAVDKYEFHNAVESYAHEWIDLLRDSIPTSFNDELLPWIWTSWVFSMKQGFKALTEIAQRESTCPITEKGKFSRDFPLPRKVIDAIEQRRLDTLGRIESLLVAKIMEQRDEQVSSGADPEDLFIRSFMPLRAFWIGFLMLEGLNWGVLNIPMSDDRSFMGVCYKSVSMSIRNMIDLNDWMVGTNPPGSRLPFFVYGLKFLDTHSWSKPWRILAFNAWYTGFLRQF